MKPQKSFSSSQNKLVDSKACVVGKEENKYICKTHGKRFTSRQYMSVHLTICGMEPLPKLKRGRKSLEALNSSFKDLPVGTAEIQLDERKPLMKKQKQPHNHARVSDSGQEAFSTSKRRKKVPHTSVSRGTTEQNCVVEQYDDIYVCEIHGLKYRSRHTINVHLMNWGMEPLAKLKRGRKSSRVPLESKRKRYEPSRSQQIVLATSTDTNDKSCSTLSPSATYCLPPSQRLDRGFQKGDDAEKRRDGCPTPSICLFMQKQDESEAVSKTP